MEDLLAGLLSGILELLADLILQFAFESICDLAVRTFQNYFSEVKEVSPILAVFGYLLLGLASGFLSVFLLPHPLVHPSKIHGISLLVSPLVTGMVMSQVGGMLRRQGMRPIRIERFAYGFTFALGLAVVRFAFVR